MEKIRILYEADDDSAYAVQHESKALNRTGQFEVDVTCAYMRSELYDMLKGNPAGYDFVVLHLSRVHERSNAYELADRIRRYVPEFSGLLVAESKIHNWGSEELTQYFDDHTGLLTEDGNLAKLLQKYRYLLGEFELE